MQKTIQLDSNFLVLHPGQKFIVDNTPEIEGLGKDQIYQQNPQIRISFDGNSIKNFLPLAVVRNLICDSISV